MSYTGVFSGQNIFPAELTLLNLALTANTELVWPTEQALPGLDVFADIIEVTPNAGLSITMPDARLAGNGQATLINNVGANTFSVLDNLGNNIGSVASGEVWQFYLQSNATQAGVWRTFEFGTGASSAVAAALAGAGLKAITTTLNVKIAPTVTAVSPIVPVAGDRAEAFVWTGGVGALTLPDPAVVGSDWFIYVRNGGTGNLTATPTAGLINGSATLVFEPSFSSVIITDGTNFYTIGFPASLSSLFDFTSINVAGTGDYTLTGAAELNRIAYRFTGVLTGNRNVIVPASVQQYWADNQTSGAFTLTVKTLAGTGVTVQQGNARILYCDGTNVVEAEETWADALVQGDLVYGSAAGVITRLAKDATATRYLSNTGTSNNPAWAQVDLTNGVTGLLPFANLADGFSLSVLGRATNSAGVMASIAGAANEVLRVNSAGTILGFGALNLASGAAVTGLLPATFGGTGLGSYAQGDIIYASAANTLAALAKNAVAVRYLSNQGPTNDPAWLANQYGLQTPLAASYTLSADSAGVIQYESAGTTTVEIPANATVAFPLGTIIPLSNGSASGAMTVTPLGGVTLYVQGTTPASFVIPAGYNGELWKVETNVWVLFTDAPAAAGIGTNYALTWDGAADEGDFAVTDDGGGIYTITHNLALANVYGLAISGIVINATSNADSAIHTTGAPGANSFVIERFSNDTRAAGAFSLVMRRVAL